MAEEIDIYFDLSKKFYYKGLSIKNLLDQQEWNLYYLLTTLSNEDGKFEFNASYFAKTLEEKNNQGFDDGTTTLYDPKTKETRTLAIVAILSNIVDEVDKNKGIAASINIDVIRKSLRYVIKIFYSKNSIVAIELNVFNFDDFRFIINYLDHAVEANADKTYNVFDRAFNSANGIKEYLVYLYSQAPEFVLRKRTIEKTGEVINNLGIISKGKVTGYFGEEKAVLKLLGSFQLIKSEFVGNQETSQALADLLLNSLILKGDGGNDVFSILYSKMNDAFGADNFSKAMKILYKVWKISSFSNPDNPIYTNYNAPDIVPYKNKKILIFNDSNFKFNVIIPEVGAVLETEYDVPVANLPSPYFGSKNAGRLPAFVTKTKVEDFGIYHIFQPVNLLNIEKEGELVTPDSPIPLFFLIAINDKKFWSNIENATWLAIDIAITLTGAGNLLKLRHLRNIAGVYGKAKVLIGTVEFVNGTAGIMLSLIDKCEDENFCNKLRTYLLYLDLLTLGVDFAVTYRKFKKASRDAAEAMSDALKKEAKEVHESLLKTAGLELEGATRLARLGFRSKSVNIKKIEVVIKSYRRKFNQRTKQGIRNIKEEWFKKFNNKIKKYELSEDVAKKMGDIFRYVKKKYDRKGRNISRGELKVYYKGKLVFPKSNEGTYWANAGENNFIPAEIGGVGSTVENKIDAAEWLDPDIADNSRLFDAEAKIFSKMDEDIAEIADRLGVPYSQLKIEVKMLSTFQPCNSCKREFLSRANMYNTIIELYVPYFRTKLGRKYIVKGSSNFEKYLNSIK